MDVLKVGTAVVGRTTYTNQIGIIAEVRKDQRHTKYLVRYQDEEKWQSIGGFWLQKAVESCSDDDSNDASDVESSQEEEMDVVEDVSAVQSSSSSSRDRMVVANVSENRIYCCSLVNFLMDISHVVGRTRKAQRQWRRMECYGKSW